MTRNGETERGSCVRGGRHGWLRARAAGIARRSGRRGAFLAFLTLLDWAYGYSLLAAPAAQQRADLLLPWTAWGWLWTAMGFVTASGIFIRRDRYAYALAAAFKTAWGAVQLDLWLAGAAPRAWVGAVIWFAFAAAVWLVGGWPEPGPVITIPPSPPGREPR